MGCAASSQGSKPAAGEAQKAVVHFRFGSANYDVFGVGTDKANITTRAAFESGKSTLFVLSVPAAREQVESYATDAATAANAENADAAAAAATAADEANNGNSAAAEGGEAATPADAAPAAPAPAAPKAPEKPVVRWAVYNDGKAEAKITCTFFHAEDVKVLGGAASKEERMDGGRLVVELTVPGTKTVPFVEGPIGGYMWKCVVKNAEGTYDLAKTYEEKP